MERYDAVVVGGGPAGLAAAIAATRAGLSVLLADVHRPPIDKLCGEGILPDGLVALEKLGVNLADAGGAPFQGISFQDDQSSFTARFPGRAGLGLRRTALHEALTAAADREGVTMRWQTRAELQGSGLLRVGKETIRCRYVIGADGHRSQVRQAAGLSAGPARLRKGQRLASGQHYAVTPWSRFVEVYWSGRTQAYVTPVGTDEVGVAFISADAEVRPDACLDLFPTLREKLGGAEVLGRVQGGTSIMLRLPQVVTERVALIGEASGSVDAITGEGLALGFRQAMALADAMEGGDLSRYEAAHRRLARRPALMGKLMLVLDGRPRLRERAIRAMALDASVFARLLAVHIGAKSQAHLAVTGAMLGWKLVGA